MYSTRSKRLARARKIRIRIAQQLKLVESGELSIRALLRNRNSHSLDRCRIDPLLRRVPNLGPKGVQRILEEANIYPTRRLGNLTPQERDKLEKLLPERVD